MSVVTKTADARPVRDRSRTPPRSPDDPVLGLLTQIRDELGALRDRVVRLERQPACAADDDRALMRALVGGVGGAVFSGELLAHAAIVPSCRRRCVDTPRQRLGNGCDLAGHPFDGGPATCRPRQHDLGTAVAPDCRPASARDASVMVPMLMPSYERLPDRTRSRRPGASTPCAMSCLARMLDHCPGGEDVRVALARRRAPGGKPRSPQDRHRRRGAAARADRTVDVGVSRLANPLTIWVACRATQVRSTSPSLIRRRRATSWVRRAPRRRS